MNVTPEFYFSHQFTGVIWNTIALPKNNVLLIEVRDQEKKQVTFSALDYKTNSFLWKDKKLEEDWWITLTLAVGGVLLFNLYQAQNDPGKKSVLAYRLEDLQLLWWKNDFSVTEIGQNAVRGVTSKTGIKEAVVDLFTGVETNELFAPTVREAADVVSRPHFYEEGTVHFSTLKKFLREKLNLSPVASFEYLEYNSLIFLSCYLREDDLENFLFVLDDAGKVLMKEKIGGQLKGIGLGTFFILEGCVIFAKNKNELVSYKIF